MLNEVSTRRRGPAAPVAVVLLAAVLLIGACDQRRPARPATAPTAAPAPSTGEERAPLLNAPPAGAGFSKPGVTESQKQEDIRFCYDRAQAIFAHDQRIERDTATFQTDTGQSAAAARFNRQLRRFGDERAISRNFERCMAERGYSRR